MTKLNKGTIEQGMTVMVSVYSKMFTYCLLLTKNWDCRNKLGNKTGEREREMEIKMLALFL